MTARVRTALLVLFRKWSWARPWLGDACVGAQSPNEGLVMSWLYSASALCWLYSASALIPQALPSPSIPTLHCCSVGRLHCPILTGVGRQQYPRLIRGCGCAMTMSTIRRAGLPRVTETFQGNFSPKLAKSSLLTACTHSWYELAVARRIYEEA